MFLKDKTVYEYGNEGHTFTGCVKDYTNSVTYFKDGKLHREDGPAYFNHNPLPIRTEDVKWTIEYVNGFECWYVNGKQHRENAPAVICSNGYEEWYNDDKLHRLDGPAIYGGGGYDFYYIDGKCLSEREWLCMVRELKLRGFLEKN